MTNNRRDGRVVESASKSHQRDRRNESSEWRRKGEEQTPGREGEGSEVEGIAEAEVMGEEGGGEAGEEVAVGGGCYVSQRRRPRSDGVKA